MKDKRTKEQIMQLLDHAMEQEEHLAQKIGELETELADCRKKAMDPRQELTEEAVPASKISFRIDYYRTEANGPLKGIIEHLPSRQNQAFGGEGYETIAGFIAVFLKEETGGARKKRPAAADKAPAEQNRAVAPSRQEITPPTGSSLLERVKARYPAGAQPRRAVAAGGPKNVDTPAMPFQKTSSLVERLREKHGLHQRAGMVKTPLRLIAGRDPASRPSRLLDRIRAEYKGKIR